MSVETVDTERDTFKRPRLDKDRYLGELILKEGNDLVRTVVESLRRKRLRESTNLGNLLPSLIGNQMVINMTDE